MVPLYGRLVDRMDPRVRLINVVTAFFVVCLLVFYVLGRAGVPLGMVFFLWIGIFNLMIVAQFWSFANDIYTKDQGERLFAIVGFGASLGAVVRLAVRRSLHQAARRLRADAGRRRRCWWSRSCSPTTSIGVESGRARAEAPRRRSPPAPRTSTRSRWCSRRAICC